MKNHSQFFTKDDLIHATISTSNKFNDLNGINLCNYIANKYKVHVELLKDATNFEVKHIIANDIIGFNIEANNPDKFNEYDQRVMASFASLPEKPNVLHFGRIRQTPKND